MVCWIVVGYRMVGYQTTMVGYRMMPLLFWHGWKGSGLESVGFVVVVGGVADGFYIRDETTADGYVLFGLCVTARCLSAQA